MLIVDDLVNISGYCDRQMVADWKLEYMGHEILKTLWTERKEAIEEACDIIRKCYTMETKQADDIAEAKKYLIIIR